MKGVPGVMVLESKISLLSFLGILMPCFSNSMRSFSSSASCSQDDSSCTIAVNYLLNGKYSFGLSLQLGDEVS